VPANAPAKNPPEERLLNLVVALMATDQGLTKDTILSNVAGYREQAESGAAKDALEKMFERDKESLRRLGVPIETIGDWADPDDLREARYRVPTAEYELPDDIEFSPAELALLNLAGSVWSESSMSDDARSGLRKIRALGIAVDEPIIGFSPRLSAREAAFPALAQAIEQSRVVSFPYLKPGAEAPRTRKVRPLALVEYEARWHVFGVDVDVAADRTFLLSRIVGPVVAGRERFDPSLREGAGERALSGLEEVAARNTALLEVNPGSEAALRLARRAQPAAQGILVPYVDIHILADELASYGPEVRVVEPEALRSQVIERLAAARDLNRERP
jgi:proteasome accessory factor B